MTIEYTLDPEDDVTGHLSNIYRKQYEYRSIIQKCVNTGDVAGKRSYVGGIVGRMDLGYLTACETSSCTITNENGSYTGGIAGLTGATVLGNFSKCTLSGKKYVGGIVGKDANARIENCTFRGKITFKNSNASILSNRLIVWSDYIFLGNIYIVALVEIIKPLITSFIESI